MTKGCVGQLTHGAMKEDLISLETGMSCKVVADQSRLKLPLAQLLHIRSSAHAVHPEPAP